MTDTCIPISKEDEMQEQQSQIHCVFKINLGYLRSSLKNHRRRKRKGGGGKGVERMGGGRSKGVSEGERRKQGLWEKTGHIS